MYGKNNSHFYFCNKKNLKMKIIITAFFLVTAFNYACAQVVKPDTLNVIASKYLNRSSKEYDPSKAFSSYLNIALNGNAKAMNAVGIMYKTASGTKADHLKAIEWFAKAGNAGYAKGFYNLALLYKDTMDFENAYHYFSQASEMNEPMAWYGQAYMLYKGLGCKQDYEKALALLKKGAYTGRSSCMYLLGLCMRNGYGTAINTDSARFWLAKSSALGYKFATDELAAKDPENIELVGALAQKIKTAQKAMPAGTPFNRYTKVENTVPAAEIEGSYSGYLIRYDWSGQHITATCKLQVTIKYENDTLKGAWIEDDSLTVPFNAILTPKALVFNGMQYSKTEHYDPGIRKLLTFEKAKLQLIKSNDTVYLAGNIQMFGRHSKEPERPQYVALVKTLKGNNSNLINIANEDGSLLVNNTLRAYPNPFTSGFTIDFALNETCNVHTAIFTQQGKMVYSNPAVRLTSGNYTLPIQVNLAAGAYIVKLYYGKQVKSTIMIKQ